MGEQEIFAALATCAVYCREHLHLRRAATSVVGVMCRHHPIVCLIAVLSRTYLAPLWLRLSDLLNPVSANEQYL
ncbi:hypothetical protein [Xanthomonas fragariae]|nr:hypothetical protein [Xanthomonas fragariae]MDM7556050.1 hypothetical protein [Xanthomonas fragariae]MDM7576820.1 hypothetical protein [Xanthomonas fragariae]MDM7579916.1 hypothetical protein [Xanthomonas fragariae]MEA5187679.1 hypothetical protein [Xanthomonas fragariae]MEA5199891.1 hypothetical protein [Xanthomonas fragariae]